MSDSAPRTPIYGPEAWLTLAGVEWSHWDLWFCLVAVLDHDGDLDRLAETIEEAGRYGSSSVERKLSHIDELRSRLARSQTDAWKLAGHAADEQRLRTKARTKVLKQGLQDRDLTDAMRTTPRERLYERALSGRWPLFPISPARFHERLVNGLGGAFVSKGKTFKLVRRFEAARSRFKRETEHDLAARLAAQRALLTWCYRAMGRCDDSYGTIGEEARDTLLDYARLPFDSTRIDATVWVEDLCELLVWEDWGLLHRDDESRPYAQMKGPLAEHAEAFLGELADELRARRLAYEADHALQNIAYLHIASGRLTRFAAVAAALGSDHWMPIVALAEAARVRSRLDIAREVFAAADQPGRQRDYLRERCIQLTGAPPGTSLQLINSAPNR